MSGPLLGAVGLLGLAGGLLVARGSLALRPWPSRLVALLLGVDTGLVLAVGVAVAAAAGRSWHLLGDPAPVDAHPVIEVSALDGDGDLFALLVIAVGGLTLLTATLFATATRSVAGTQPGDRAVVASVLWGEVLLTGYAVVQLVVGTSRWWYVLLALHLPLSAAALVLHHRRPANHA